MNPGVVDSGKDPVMAMLTVDLPLWYRKHRAEKREADARVQAALRSRSDHENALMADLRLALYRFRDGERRVELYGRELIPRATESLGVTKQAYAAGKADFQDLVEAQRTLLEFGLSYERALVDRAVRLAELEMLAGEDAPGVGQPSGEQTTGPSR